MKSPRIAIAVFEVPGWGGAATTRYDLFARMQRDGLDVTFINLVHPGDALFFQRVLGPTFGNPAGLANVQTEVLALPLFRRQESLAASLDATRPDLLVGVGFIATRLLRLASPRLPLVMLSTGSRRIKHLIANGTIRDFVSFRRNVEREVRYHRFVDDPETEAEQAADLIIPHAAPARFALAYFSGWQAAKMYPRDLSMADVVYDEALRSGPGRPFAERDIDVLFASSSWLDAEKNLPLLRRLVAAMPQRAVHVAGELDDPLPVRRHGLVARGALLDLMRRAKVFVSPSLFDAAPNVLFEASAMGCNVVASPNCGNVDLCHDSLRVDRPTVAGFVESIERALRMPYADNRARFVGGYAELVDTLMAMAASGPTRRAPAAPVAGALSRVAAVTLGASPASDGAAAAAVRPTPDRTSGESAAARVSPEVTVSMPAYNSGRFVRQALESVLSQEGIVLEVIVVDDASTDDTAAVVEAIADPRVRLVRHATNRGIAACHNTVLRLAAAPVIAHVDADDVVLPGALRKLADAVLANPRVAQAHCHFFDIDADGKPRRTAVRERVAIFHATRRPPIDYRRRLPTSAGMINHLRTYRTAVLRELGGFDERLRVGEDYDMALRLLERHEIAVVPEFLYCWRHHATNTNGEPPLLRRWWVRFTIRRRVVREGRVTYWRRPGLHLVPVLRQIARARRAAVTAPVARVVRRLRPWLRWACIRPLKELRYRGAVWAASRLPVDRLFATGPTAGPPGRLAYYLGGFPTHSETFIQREVDGLEAAGVPVAVFALEARGREHFDRRATRLMRRTHYMEASEGRGRGDARRLFCGDPLRFLACRAFVTSRRHARRKSARADATIFRSAVRLATALRAAGVTHLHSPWANRHAFVAMVAAALTRIPYSVQARAYDVHREGQLALDDKLAHADFVITNTAYNAGVLRVRLPRVAPPPLHVIHNGIDLAEFPAAPPPFAEVGRCRLLLVGRLVEQKGIEYLLRACRLLADEGRSVTCTVVGGRVPEHINHVVHLMKLVRSLALEDLVTFAGPRPAAEVMPFYAAADLVVLPCVITADGSRDVTPNVLLEAMAMRRPVVSTTVTGIPELVVHEQTGLLVPPGDAAGLAAAIARLMDAPAYARELGENGRARVEALFDINKNSAAFRALFAPRVETTAPPSERPVAQAASDHGGSRPAAVPARMGDATLEDGSAANG